MPEASQRTALASAVLAHKKDDQGNARKAVLEQTHAIYGARQEAFVLLSDAYEGEGGFLTGAYLWKFPAELKGDFDERKAQARYHPFLETIVDIYLRHLFGQGVTRTTTDEDLEAWWADIDGAGTPIGEFAKDACGHALVQGHAGVLVDRTPDAPTGPTKADERSRVIATLYPADTILDWRLQGHELTAVKLSEAAPEPAITDGPEDAAPNQFLLWDKQEWARFDADGELLSDATHDLGLVPLAMLRPKASKRHPFIGRPLVNHNVVRALYNRASEEDHVLRNQGFSLLGVQVPVGASAEEIEITQKNVEANYGLKRAIVGIGSLGYASPDMAIPTAIRENMQFLIRELWRAAHIAYDRDSLEAESAESLRIKHVELNEMLRNLAASMTALELRMARYWFGWDSTTPEEAQRRFEAAAVTAQYPSEFFLKELEADIRAWAEAIRLGLPDLFVKRIKKRVVRRIEPDMPADVAKEIDEAIDAMPEKQPGVMTGGDPMDPEAMKLRAAERLKAFVKQPPVDVEGEGAAA